MSEGESFLDDMEEEDGDSTGDAEVVDLEEDNLQPTHEGKGNRSLIGSQEEGGLLKPVTEDLNEIAETYETYDRIKNELLNNRDIQTIGGNAFIKKSGLRKIATAFNISLSVAHSHKTVEDGVVRYEVTARASAPNGKSADGIGMAGSNESNFTIDMSGDYDEEAPEDNVFLIDGKYRKIPHPRAVDEHDLHALAETRAKNRAISDLVGGGDVSAEEMDADAFI